MSAARRDELLAEGGAAAHGRAEIGEKSVQVVAGQGSVHGATEAGPGQGAQGPAPGHPEGRIRRQGDDQVLESQVHRLDE